MTIRVLSLGWGIQSFTLAAMMAEGEIPPVDYAIHADTTHERTATYQHAEKWTPWLEERGVHVITVAPEDSSVVARGNEVPIPAFFSGDRADGLLRRQCTDKWKVGPIRKEITRILEAQGLKKTPGVVEMVIGISWDEALRMKDSRVAYITHDYPLVDKRITRAACIHWLETHGIEQPPKSACVFCPYHSQASWVDLARENGPDWEKAVAVDDEIRAVRSPLEIFVHSSMRPLPVAVGERSSQMSLEFVEEQPCDSGTCWT